LAHKPRKATTGIIYLTVYCVLQSQNYATRYKNNDIKQRRAVKINIQNANSDTQYHTVIKQK